jgi:hypothetical protein
MQLSPHGQPSYGGQFLRGFGGMPSKLEDDPVQRPVFAYPTATNPAVEPTAHRNNDLQPRDIVLVLNGVDREGYIVPGAAAVEGPPSLRGHLRGTRVTHSATVSIAMVNELLRGYAVDVAKRSQAHADLATAAPGRLNPALPDGGWWMDPESVARWARFVGIATHNDVVAANGAASLERSCVNAQVSGPVHVANQFLSIERGNMATGTSNLCPAASSPLALLFTVENLVLTGELQIPCVLVSAVVADTLAGRHILYDGDPLGRQPPGGGEPGEVADMAHARHAAFPEPPDHGHTPRAPLEMGIVDGSDMSRVRHGDVKEFARRPLANGRPCCAVVIGRVANATHGATLVTPGAALGAATDLVYAHNSTNLQMHVTAR